MSLRVVSDLVSSRSDFANQRRLRRRVSANQKKSRLGIVPIEKVQQARRHRWIRSVIERQSQRLLVARKTDRWPENLRSGRKRAPGEHAGSCASPGGNSNRELFHDVMDSRTIRPKRCAAGGHSPAKRAVPVRTRLW